MKNSKVFLAPHNDDEILFGAYTIMREKPLVVIVTDSYIQQERGDEATTEQRIEETKEAMKLLGVEVDFLHIPDNSFKGKTLQRELEELYLDDIQVYAPAIEFNGNPIHNEVGLIADLTFYNVKHYMTYVLGNDKTKGGILVFPTEEEKKLKKKALACYKSQLKIPTCATFFNHPKTCDWESFE